MEFECGGGEFGEGSRCFGTSFELETSAIKRRKSEGAFFFAGIAEKAHLRV